MKIKYRMTDNQLVDRCPHHDREIYIGGLYCIKDCPHRGEYEREYESLNIIDCRKEKETI